jgi:fatty acid desaturase
LLVDIATAGQERGPTSPEVLPTSLSSPVAARYVSQFHELTQKVTSAGLMRRRYGFYWTAFSTAALALAAVWTGVVLLDDSWLQLILAAALGVILAQLGFLGHEANHRQIFKSARWNEWTGRVVSGLLVGLSYGWWMNKHSRHHASPNHLGKDPDIESDAVALSADEARRRHGLGRRMLRHQGIWFLPLLALTGLGLHVSSVARVLSRRPLKHRLVEITFLGLRILGYLVLVFLLLPPGIATAFVGVQVAVFGFLLGGAFATNHIAMPIVPRGISVDFLHRQVLMSRDISGGPVVRFLMGGLDTQVEHHLFPGMPRPNLRHAQRLVRDYCSEHDIVYTETSVWSAYAVILRYLRQVGLGKPDPFVCPLVQQYRT